MGLSKLGCASQNSSKSTQNPVPCLPAAPCRTLLLKPPFPHVGRTLHQDQVGQDRSLTRVSRCPPVLPPFFFPLVYPLVICRPACCSQQQGLPGGQGRVWVQALLAQRVFRAQGRGCLQSLLPRGVQQVQVTGWG